MSKLILIGLCEFLFYMKLNLYIYQIKYLILRFINSNITNPIFKLFNTVFNILTISWRVSNHPHDQFEL